MSRRRTKITHYHHIRATRNSFFASKRRRRSFRFSLSSMLFIILTCSFGFSLSYFSDNLTFAKSAQIGTLSHSCESASATDHLYSFNLKNTGNNALITSPTPKIAWEDPLLETNSPAANFFTIEATENGTPISYTNLILNANELSEPFTRGNLASAPIEKTISFSLAQKTNSELTPAQISELPSLANQKLSLSTNSDAHLRTIPDSNWNDRIINSTTCLASNISAPILKFTVIWNNYDHSTLETDRNVPYGSSPIYNGPAPQKFPTAEQLADPEYSYSYVFNGWSPSLSPVTSDITYTAEFQEIKTKNTYTVTWQNEDSTILEIDHFVEYGSIPTYNSPIPNKDSTPPIGTECYTLNNATNDCLPISNGCPIGQYYGAMGGWYGGGYPISTRVINDQTHCGYEETNFFSYPITVIWHDLPQATKYTGGSYHIFAGWSPEPSIVTGDATYTAKYNIIQSSNEIINNIRMENNGSLSIQFTVDYATLHYYLSPSPYPFPTSIEPPDCNNTSYGQNPLLCWANDWNTADTTNHRIQTQVINTTNTYYLFILQGSTVHVWPIPLNVIASSPSPIRTASFIIDTIPAPDQSETESISNSEIPPQTKPESNPTPSLTQDSSPPSQENPQSEISQNPDPYRST